MNAPSRRKPSLPEPVPEARSVGSILRERRSGVGAIAVLLVAAAVGTLLWSRVAPQIVSEDEVLHPDRIELRGKAPWVKADIRAEALRDSSLDHGLPLTDPELPTRLARAFDMHPWVRRVVRVDLRHPAAATVEVQCREPAAMVSVAGGLLAVDAEGVVLPSADFTPEAAASYPRLAGIESSPQGPEGAVWGDPAVEEGAALAHVIQPEWRALGLSDCRFVMVGGGDVERRVWELVGADGTIYVFGAAPGREEAGEATAAVKVARLKGFSGNPPAPATGRVDLRDEPVPPGR